MKPPPPIRVHVHVDGLGQGRVVSKPAGVACTRRCAVGFEAGTELELTVELDPDSTFLGWSGDCTPRPDRILSCTLTLDRDAEVHAELGRVPKQVEVAWVEVEDQDQDEAITVRLPDPDIEAEMLVEPLAELLPELAQVVPAPPQAEVPPPPPEQAPAATPPPPPEMANMRSVELADDNEVEEAPDDATHLSDKNRDVAEEIRAEDTNLERQMAGEERFSERSEVESEDIGAEDDVIAELEDTEATSLDEVEHDESSHTGDSERALGAVVGEQGEGGDDGEGGDGRESAEPGMLAMRGIGGRGSIVADEGRAGRGGERGAPGRKGLPGIDSALAFEDYERIVGTDKVEEEIALGKKRMSRRRGRWERKMEVMRSALENFTPEVRTGNQTALKTRAAPFAVYIARMHRRIHPLWGFGFLEDLNDKPANHPMNNWDLATKLEIVINGDGTVHKINIVTHSGLLEFDVAAIDTIMTAAPYEPPPEKIRSPDGRAYMHWGFFRNYRQCGTFNAQPFILDQAPAESDGAMDDSELVRRVPRRGRDARSAAAEMPVGRSVGTPATGVPSAEDPQAVHTANLWITGFTKRNPSRMLQVSTTPFQVGAETKAETASALGAAYQTLLAETRARMSDWRLMTAAGYRKRLGDLPAGLESESGQLLLVVQSGTDRFVLTLARQSDGTYKVSGLFR
ncbi:hypothetical protein [Haliangium sp.]